MQAARGTSLIKQRTTSTARVRYPRLVVVGVAVAVLVADVLTKHLAVDRLKGREPVEVIDGVLRLELTRNPGAAFGFARGLTVVLTVIALGVVAAIVRAAGRLSSPGWVVALGFVLGGAVGNLTDRIFREPGFLRGHVIDFLHVPHWPLFNIADSAICTGGVLMVLLSMLGIRFTEPVAGPVDGTGPEPTEDAPQRREQA